MRARPVISPTSSTTLSPGPATSPLATCSLPPASAAAGAANPSTLFTASFAFAAPSLDGLRLPRVVVCGGCHVVPDVCRCAIL